MAELRPIGLGDLLGRLQREWPSKQRLFDMEGGDFWRGSPLDLGVAVHGQRASTPVGPAAGPHSQLAQNIAMAWLAGSRIVELKTVQINDQLVIPRPCIDVQTVGFNVEWSQELRLEQSALEYAKAWVLVHALAAWNPLGLKTSELDTVFDLSVGYSLAGVQSERVARWIDGLRDGRALIAQARQQVPSELQHLVQVPVPDCVSRTLTLSTFHGCPADEIEKIAEHLLVAHDLDVVLKLNPTLLGHDFVAHTLNDVLGYKELRVRPDDFAHDLQWPDALALIGRLRAVAERQGRALGVKVSNTLVVENHKDFFPKTEKVMYLSGQPLHVLTSELGARVDAALNHEVPLSFSAGVDAVNFAEVVACGFVPVTVCTALLRPGGYGRLPKYLARLQSDMEKLGVADLPAYVAAKDAGKPGQFLQDYAKRVPTEARYAAAKNASIPRRLAKDLQYFDCVDCGKCVPVCPNGANFALKVMPRQLSGDVLVVQASGQVTVEAGPVQVLAAARQFLNFADACNECGNCDVFCPEVGGPYRVKPRFFSSEASLHESPHLDGLWAQSATAALGRIDGQQVRVAREGTHLLVDDGQIQARLDAATGAVLSASCAETAAAGHRLPAWRAAALGLLLDLALQEPTSVQVPE
ncbi:MAG: glutamate synthase [Deltaproteobacteria bacterium]|nr:glutamate synthase [Deltaproteobacteria bacterium]